MQILFVTSLGPAEFGRIIVDTAVREKTIAHPIDSRLFDVARAKVVQAARQAGIGLKQTFSKGGKALRCKASGNAHAKKFERLCRTVKRQRAILCIVRREIQRKLPAATSLGAATLSHPNTLLERAAYIWCGFANFPLTLDP